MYVLPQWSEIENRETERVGAVLRDHVERVGGIAERLAHLPPLGVADDARKVDVPERHDIADAPPWRSAGKRNFAHYLESRHDHSGNPKEYNIGSGDQCIGRIKIPKVGIILWPSERGERPEPCGEPRVENILVLPEVRRAAVRAAFRLRPRDDRLLAFKFASLVADAVPDRDAVSPPELPGDAPIADVRQPVLIGLHPPLGVEADVSVQNRPQGGSGKRFHLDEPLVG